MEKVKEKETTAGFTDGYIGTYYSELTAPELFYEARNSKWISLSSHRMVIPDEKGGMAGTCFLELNHGSVKKCAGEVLQERQTPCYIEQEEDFIYTANYHEGTVMIYQTTEEKPATRYCFMTRMLWYPALRRTESGSSTKKEDLLLLERSAFPKAAVQDTVFLIGLTPGFML